MSDKNKKIVEINGIKVEVDMREAKKIEKFKVGDPIRVLWKKYSEWKTSYGVIIDFTEFQHKPAIDILYVKEDYDKVELIFKTITEDSEDIEIAPINNIDLKFSRGDILKIIQEKIEEEKEKLRVLKFKKEEFKKYFGREAE